MDHLKEPSQKLIDLLPGHRLTIDGIELGVDKLQLIVQWSEPKINKMLEKFLLGFQWDCEEVKTRFPILSSEDTCSSVSLEWKSVGTAFGVPQNAELMTKIVDRVRSDG